MGKLLVEKKSVVVPGEVLAEGMDYLPAQGTYRDGDSIVAQRLGLAYVDKRLIKIIPLSGRYLPKSGDTIICKVTDIALSAWILDTNTAYNAMLSLRDGTSEFVERGADLTQYYTVGDYLVGRITNVTTQNLIDLTMKGPGLRKLSGGRIMKISSAKVPRVIGKGGSMVSMIKQATNCKIIVGQNGVIWISGEPEMEIKAVETIKKIEREAHKSGLTDSIKAFLEQTGKSEE